MRVFAILLFAVATAATTTVTVTVPCESRSATNVPAPASPVHAVAAPYTPPSPIADISFTGASVILRPVSNPNSDPSDIGHIVPKSNLTLLYGSNDTSTPEANAQISLQMKFPSV